MLAPSRFLISDNFRFEVSTRELFRFESDGSARPVSLGSRATDILLLFLQRPGDLITKNEIMEAVWPNTAVEESNLPVQIAAVRRALDNDRDGGSTILTVPGRGYRFTLPVRLEDESRADPLLSPAPFLKLTCQEAQPDGSNPALVTSGLQFGAVAGPASQYSLGRMAKWMTFGIGTATVFFAAALAMVNRNEFFAGRFLQPAAIHSVERSAPQERGRCDGLPGVWEWFSGRNAYFYPDGHLRGGSFTGSWDCTLGEVVIAWSHGHTDRVTISSNGSYLSGFNDVNTPVWGRRIGNL